MSVRLGAISFLNVRPLIHTLPADGSFALRYSVPSVCAAELAAGAVDAGLIPSIEYARSQRPYCIVPGLAIAAEGEVMSVRLYYRPPLRQVRRVALDTSSRTSVALLQILLRERYGLAPEWVAAPPDLPAMLAAADAALLIGDAVFAHGRAAGVPSLDLGREWTEHTGLPFVFAFWAGHPGALDEAAVRALQRAGEEGVAHIDEIARQHARAHGGDAALYARYLRRHIRFALGAREEEGLRLFYAKARQQGLIEAVPALCYYAAGAGP